MSINRLNDEDLNKQEKASKNKSASSDSDQGELRAKVEKQLETHFKIQEDLIEKLKITDDLIKKPIVDIESVKKMFENANQNLQMLEEFRKTAQAPIDLIIGDKKTDAVKSIEKLLVNDSEAVNQKASIESTQNKTDSTNKNKGSKKKPS